MFHVDPSRGSVVLENLLGLDYAGIISCDFWGACKKFARLTSVELQFCRAHLIREMKFLAESKDKPVARYGNRLLKKIRKMFSTIHRRGELSTCEQQGTNVMSFLKSCVESFLHGLAPPSLLEDGFFPFLAIFQPTGLNVRERLPDNKPLIDRIKGNIAKIDQILSRAEVTERILSPLPLSLHNPLALSEKVVESEAEEMTIEHVISELQDEYEQIVALGYEKRFGYYDYDVFLNDEEWFQDEFMVCFEDRLKGNDLFDPEKRKQFIIETVEAKNMEIIARSERFPITSITSGKLKDLIRRISFRSTRAGCQE